LAVPSKSRALVEHALAKVNLTLRVIGRRADGYHTLESLVVFAGVKDRLAFASGQALGLTVNGPNAAAAGAIADNLVLRAARALTAEIDGLKLGRFTLTKHLPAAAGVGGGSSDAAAALRLIARANRLKLTDPRLLRAAARIGADVPVCVDPRSRVMRGIGEILSKPLRIPRFNAVLVNPGDAVPTKDVFAQLHRSDRKPQPAAQAHSVPSGRAAFLAYLKRRANDLEPAAVVIAPEIAKLLDALQKTPGCELARMSGSGATCFGLYASAHAATAAARSISRQHRRWWVCATHLG
jgi:4-diphosphocytidyl-2-C-methyl-D-erythritol kinase